ncbi:PREDICTED: probable carboxylesterase 11 [Ipomoea nil]|uniref:probable carboxylesterase 11 n=1 Tax=Ipomoea nil TaxID=35883 RepID=UPI0009011DE8|nr:PREDICTED: probable carboxylesterase 11 [Ipomoea nil]
MPSVGVKFSSVVFKHMLKHRLQNRIQNVDGTDGATSFGVTSRPEEEPIAAANPVFADAVATKDIHIDPLTSLSLRIFLPDTCLNSPDSHPKLQSKSKDNDSFKKSDSFSGPDPNQPLFRRNSIDSLAFNNIADVSQTERKGHNRRNSDGWRDIDLNLISGENGVYIGYSPAGKKPRKLPVMLQFHSGGFVSGSNNTVANDLFCRRIAKLCDVIVLGVGYRLAPENRFPAAFEDGLKVLHWLAKQSNLAGCSKSQSRSKRGGGGGADLRKSDVQEHVADAFGASMVEPWLAAHADPSRCVLLGVSCGGNIVDYVTRKAVEAGKLLDPVRVVAQVLMYPFFIGSVPMNSEIKLANSYFYDKETCILAWKLLFPEEEFDLDHPAANPLVPGRGPPLKKMPPTLTVVAEHDWMQDRAIAYAGKLRKVNVDAPVLYYKDAVHEFATIGMLLNTPQAQACAEDISIWVKKYISLRGHEFSY